MYGENKQHQEINMFLAVQMRELLYNRALSTMLSFSKSKDIVMRSFLKALNPGVEAVRKKIAQGEKKSIKYIHFSYLLSEAEQKKLVIKIDFYDDRYYEDINDVDSFWRYDMLFPYIDEDVELLYEKLRKHFVRLQDYSLLDLRMLYCTVVFHIMKSVMKNLTADQVFCDALNGVGESEVVVMYGAYLDSSEMINMIESGGEQN